MAVPYVDYNELREFYTIKDVCKLFEMSKDELRNKCMEYDIQLSSNEIGEWGLVKYDVRKLHNLLYHEGRSKKRVEDDDPWA